MIYISFAAVDNNVYNFVKFFYFSSNYEFDIKNWKLK